MAFIDDASRDTRRECWHCAGRARAAARVPALRGAAAAAGGGLICFAVLGLPRRLVVDRDDLERRYHDASRAVHPGPPSDGGRARPRAEPAASAAVNRAYRTLRDPVARGRYWLELHGDAARRAQQPGAARRSPRWCSRRRSSSRSCARPAARPPRGRASRRCGASWTRGSQALEAELEARYAAWDAGDGAATADALAELKRRLSEIAYLSTLHDDVEEALARKRLTAHDGARRRHRSRHHQQPGRGARRRRAARAARSRDRRAPAAVRGRVPARRRGAWSASAARALAAERPVRHHPVGQALHGARPRARERRGPAALSLRRGHDAVSVRFRGRRPRASRRPRSRRTSCASSSAGPRRRSASPSRRPSSPCRRTSTTASARRRKDAGRLAGLEVLRLVNEPTAAALAYGLERARRGHDRGLRPRRRHLRRLHPEARAAASSRCWRPTATRGSAATTSTRASPTCCSPSCPRRCARTRRCAPRCSRWRSARSARCRTRRRPTSSWRTPDGAGDPPRRHARRVRGAGRATSSSARAGRAGRRSRTPASTPADVERGRRGRRLDARAAGAPLHGGALRPAAARRASIPTRSWRSAPASRPASSPAAGATCCCSTSSRCRSASRPWAACSRASSTATSTIPVSHKENFTTAVDNQTSVDVHVLQGERELATDNRSLARFSIPIEPLPAGRAAPRGDVPGRRQRHPVRDGDATCAPAASARSR